MLLCVLFSSYHATTSAWAINNYGYFGRINAITLRNLSLDVFNNPASIILTRLIAFAYTYHYLNWFSKTRIINWHQVTMTRAVFIGVIWAASVSYTHLLHDLKLGLLFLRR